MNVVFINLQQPKNLHLTRVYQILVDQMLSAGKRTALEPVPVLLISSAILTIFSKDVAGNVNSIPTAYLTWAA